jgi:hypothetical protein
MRLARIVRRVVTAKPSSSHTTTALTEWLPTIRRNIIANETARSAIDRPLTSSLPARNFDTVGINKPSTAGTVDCDLPSFLRPLLAHDDTILTTTVRVKEKKMPRRLVNRLKHNACRSEDGSILSLKREIQLLSMAPERINTAMVVATQYVCLDTPPTRKTTVASHVLLTAPTSPFAIRKICKHSPTIPEALYVPSLMPEAAVLCAPTYKICKHSPAIPEALYVPSLMPEAAVLCAPPTC